MSDLISKEALIEELKKSRKYHAQNGRELELLCRCENIVNEQPTVEAVPVVYGELERIPYSFVGGYRCSCCGQKTLERHWNFCPKCGADMRKKGD